jgi:hypothetical protein
MASAKNVPDGDGIRADESLPIAEFMRRNRFGVKTLRSARRNGLRVCRVGRNSFVLGSDWHKYLAEKSATV